MVSCSGFGLPMHAQLLRLFVTKQRDAIGGISVKAQRTAGNPKRHTPRRRAGPRARTNTRTGAHEQGPKQPATTRNTQRARGGGNKQSNTHGAQQPWLQPNKSMRLHPDTRERSNRSTAPTATTEAPGKPPEPETLPGPGRQRQSRRHTNDTSRTSP